MSLRYVCVAHHDMSLVFIFHKNAHDLFQHYVIFLRVAVAAATDCVSQSRCSMLEMFLYGCVLYLILHH